MHIPFETTKIENMKKKVLVIDDEQDACNLMSLFFRRHGFDVVSAVTLQEGLQQIETQHPDIIFLDNQLPDGFGWDYTSNIVSKYPDVDLNLISAYNKQTIDFSKYPKVKMWQKPLSYNRLLTEFEKRV